MKDNLETKIEVAIEQIKQLRVEFTDFKGEQKRFNDKLQEVQEESARMKERLSNMSIFQSVLSVIIGAIATYLGTKK